MTVPYIRHRSGNAYGWEQVVPDGAGGWADVPAEVGRLSGGPTAAPAWELSGSEAVPADGSVVAELQQVTGGWVFRWGAADPCAAQAARPDRLYARFCPVSGCGPNAAFGVQLERVGTDPCGEPSWAKSFNVVNQAGCAVSGRITVTRRPGPPAKLRVEGFYAVSSTGCQECAGQCAEFSADVDPPGGPWADLSRSFEFDTEGDCDCTMSLALLGTYDPVSGECAGQEDWPYFCVTGEAFEGTRCLPFPNQTAAEAAGYTVVSEVGSSNPADCACGGDNGGYIPGSGGTGPPTPDGPTYTGPGYYPTKRVGGCGSNTVRCRFIEDPSQLETLALTGGRSDTLDGCDEAVAETCVDDNCNLYCRHLDGLGSEQTQWETPISAGGDFTASGEMIQFNEAIAGLVVPGWELETTIAGVSYSVVYRTSPSTLLLVRAGIVVAEEDVDPAGASDNRGTLRLRRCGDTLYAECDRWPGVVLTYSPASGTASRVVWRAGAVSRLCVGDDCATPPPGWASCEDAAGRGTAGTTDSLNSGPGGWFRWSVPGAGKVTVAVPAGAGGVRVRVACDGPVAADLAPGQTACLDFEAAGNLYLDSDPNANIQVSFAAGETCDGGGGGTGCEEGETEVRLRCDGAPLSTGVYVELYDADTSTYLAGLTFADSECVPGTPANIYYVAYDAGTYDYLDDGYVSVTGGVATITVCPPVPRYNCVNGFCVEAGGGTYEGLAACLASGCETCENAYPIELLWSSGGWPFSASIQWVKLSLAFAPAGAWKFSVTGWTNCAGPASFYSACGSLLGTVNCGDTACFNLSGAKEIWMKLAKGANVFNVTWSLGSC